MSLFWVLSYWVILSPDFCGLLNFFKGFIHFLFKRPAIFIRSYLRSCASAVWGCPGLAVVGQLDSVGPYCPGSCGLCFCSGRQPSACPWFWLDAPDAGRTPWRDRQSHGPDSGAQGTVCCSPLLALTQWTWVFLWEGKQSCGHESGAKGQSLISSFLKTFFPESGSC